MQDGFLRIAIVARVVDNFGDAGVAWRLARQLVTEHGADVTLWIDAVGVLARFMPALDPACPDAIVANVRVRHLAAEAPPLHPWPEVVVQMFGCALPEAWLFTIEHSAAPPVWINLEYLSAEDWVEGAHGLPSPHPHRALKRWFFYPGFTARTGGLLRERDLPEPAAAERVQAWADVGLPPPPPDALAVSLFCYPTLSAYALLDAWSREARPVHALVPDGVAGEAVSAFLGAPLRPGDVHVRGSLVLAGVPFVDQPGFDQRLRACDFSVVRGEDSFVRAQWARRPFAWHIYPQEDDAHRVKLDAFLARYLAGVAAEPAAALVAFTHAFNAGDVASLRSAWPALRDALPALRAHAVRWATAQSRYPDLATQLVEFARARL